MLRRLCINSFACTANQRTFSVLTKQLIAAFYQSDRTRCSTNTLAITTSPLSNRIQSLFFCTDGKDAILNSNTVLDDEVADPKAKVIQKIFQCSDAEAMEVLEFLPTLSRDGRDGINLRAINKTVRWLHRCGATLPIIMKNCHLLLIPIDQLKRRFERLSRSKWKQIDDFVPLLAVEETKIKNIQLYQGHVVRNRIYLLNELFSIEPHIISHFCAKHLFIFEIELELLKQKINMLTSCGVSPEYILRDLNVLARAKEVIEERLEFIKKCGIERVMPWMIKCDDQILMRSIEIRNQRETEQNKTLELLADRLNWHGQTANSMFMKYKFLQKLDPNTASELLDELLRIFSPDDITANISLLNLSVGHVKIRVDELIALNSSLISPQILNMSDTHFKQYLNKVKKE